MNEHFRTCLNHFISSASLVVGGDGDVGARVVNLYTCPFSVYLIFSRMEIFNNKDAQS